MKKLSALVVIFSATQLFFIGTLRAEPVTNWHTFRATTATTLSGQGTSSPIVGSSTAPATSAVLAGYFDSIALTNLGDRITFSFQMSFTDAAGFSTAGDQLRFALFDLNGQTPVAAENTATAGVNGQTDDWRGYWFGHRGGGGAGANGSIRERPATLIATDNPFSNTGTDPAPSLGPVGGSPVTLQSSTDPAGGPVFSGVMALESTPSGIALAGLLGGNGTTNIFIANDNASPFPANYGAVGYLFGGSMNVDQVNLQNVTVTYSPSNALHIVNQPTNTSALAGQPATFSVAVAGSGLIPTYQWREDGFDIFDATNSVYTIPAVDPSQNAHVFTVVVNNVFGGTVTSSSAVLNVIEDVTPPTVLSASSLVSNVVNVIFSEPVDPSTAQDGSSYSVAGNTISFINLVGGTNAVLTLDTPIAAANVSVTVQNVKDLFANTMTTTNFNGTANGFQESVSFIANGLAYALNDKIVLEAGGSDIFNSADQGQFVYKTFSGDFDISVRVESLFNSDANAKAGLMARVNAISDSRNVMIEATPARFIYQYRTNAAGNGSFALGSPRPATAFPDSFVRLKRTGSVFTAYSSTNNGIWTLMGSYDTAIDAEGAYPNDILLGLAATSHDLNENTTAVFSNFAPAVIAPPALTISNSGGNVEITWSSPGFNLQSTTNLTSPITWTTIAGSSSTNRVIIPLTESASFFRLSE